MFYRLGRYLFFSSFGVCLRSRGVEFESGCLRDDRCVGNGATETSPPLAWPVPVMRALFMRTGENGVQFAQN